MKFSVIILLGLAIAVSAAPAKQEALNEAQKEILAKGILDFLSGFAQQVLLPPIVTAVQNSAGLLAQLTAGVGEGGLDAVLGLIGKRQAEYKGVWGDLVSTVSNLVTNGAYDIANQLASQLGLTLTQILLQVSQGKRSVQEMKGAFDDILAALQSSLYPIANQLVSQLGITITQALAQISQGKRSAVEMKGAFDDIMAAVQTGIYNAANQLVQQLHVTVTQALIQISQGKRGLWDDLQQQLGQQIGQIAQQVIGPAVNASIQQLAGMLAQMTASIAVDGLPAAQNILNSILG